MLLMIDNYDSFTFNLVHYFQSLGQTVKVLRNNEFSLNDIENLKPDYIVISPGPCDPSQAGKSLEVIRHFAGKTPLLGVCLGHQCIAQAFGGVIEKAQKVMHGKTCEISHNQKGLFKDIAQPLTVTRYHSLVINQASLPPEFEVTAWSDCENNEDREIMAIQHQKLAITGVQFHPESIMTEQGHALLNNFIEQYA